jgi:hypothetical protein
LQYQLDKLHTEHQCGYQDAFQIDLEIQKLDHIFRNKPLRCYFLRVYPYQITGISAYKDPVEIQHMRKILDKFVTGFFVVVLGIAWYCSTKFYIKPDKNSIVVYDVFGKEVKLDGVRVDFRTHGVAQSYISEYKKRYPHYNFAMAIEIPEIKNNTIPRIFKKIHR